MDEKRAYMQTSVWVEVTTEIGHRVTLGYSCLEIGQEVTVFLGHSPAEVLVNIHRLADELAVMEQRIASE